MTTHVNTATERTPGEAEIRTWEDLRASGLLWLINRQVFHPRGFALALVQVDGEIVGLRLLGHGQEPWAFAGSEDEWFAAAQATLAALPSSAGRGQETPCFDCGQREADHVDGRCPRYRTGERAEAEVPDGQ